MSDALKVSYAEQDLWYEGENRVADAIVMAGFEGTRYILLVEREFGYALPGGFVTGNKPGFKAAERSARREVLEETNLQIPSWAKGEEIVSYNFRNYRKGNPKRWISARIFFYDVGELQFLPEVTNDYDPDGALIGCEWVELEEAVQAVFFADHGEILSSFLAEKFEF